MLNRRSLGAFTCIVIVASNIVFLGCTRKPSLEERIKTTASRLASRRDPTHIDSSIGAAYEREVVELAKESTGALESAFRSLDLERSSGPGHWTPNDNVWLTGILITILAFDCPPISKHDNQTWYLLKSRLIEPDELLKSKPSQQADEKLAKWPWSDEGGSWHLSSIDVNNWGTSKGAITPFFEYYTGHFRRRTFR